MTPRTITALLCISLVPLAGCGSSEEPPPPKPRSSSSGSPSASATVSAPKGVPQDFAQRVREIWPKLEERAKEAEPHWKAFQEARNDQDRDAMNEHGREASAVYGEILEKWDEVVYSVPDDDDEALRAIDRYISGYQRIAKKWRSRQKVLKEFSTR